MNLPNKTRPVPVALIAIALACALTVPTTSAASGAPRETSRAETVIVKYRAGVASTANVSVRVRGLRVRRTLLGGAGVVVEVPEGRTAEDLARELTMLPAVEYAEPDARVQLQWVPDDPGYSRQWAYSHIQAPDAWDVTIGSSDVVVAVLDTGVDLDHPDLDGNILPGGYDFGDDDTDVSDHNGHGTHCSGIVAAESDNATGVAGTAPRVGILPVKVFSDGGIGTTSMVADGIRFAADAGADIITMSLGGTETTAYLEQAIAYARSQGVLLVASAGNASQGVLLYPARSPGVIGVVATNDSDSRASFSNYGLDADLAAPGTDIYSTVVNGYAEKSGTSMATPYVTGALALLRSSSSTASPEQLVVALQATAKDLGDPGWDRLTGYGLIQIRDAIEHLGGEYSWDATPPVTVSDAASSYLRVAHIVLQATDDGGSGVATTRYRLDGGTEVTGTEVAVTAYGPHTLSYRSIDNAGNAERTVTVAFSVLDSIGPDVARIYGTGRYETCVALSAATYASGSVPTVVMASGEDFADALSASALAGAYGSPLLLTAKAALPAVVESEIGRLGATRVLLVGGTAAVNSTVEGALVRTGVSVERIVGADRYETAAKASRVVRQRLGPAMPNTVFIARGDMFADALALAPLSASRGIPVLLVRPAALPAVTAAAIAELAADDVVIAGGTKAVSEGVRQAISALPGVANVTRLPGADRYETAAVIARYAIGARWATSDYIGLGTGMAFPDALGGGVVTGAHGGVLLLTQQSALPAATRDFITSQGEIHVAVRVFGGTAAVADPVLSAVAAIRF
jgi:subtilisin family serine protease